MRSVGPNDRYSAGACCRQPVAPGEYISYSVWQNQASIDRYRAGEAHQQIKRHGARLATIGPPVVKEYVLV